MSLGESPHKEPGPRRVDVPSTLAAAFVLGCLATIPVGVPVPNWMTATLGSLGALVVMLARFDRAGRWEQVTWWPVAAILGAMAISVARCRLPGLAFERSTSAGVFAMVAITVQVAAWRERALRAVLWGCVVLVAVMAADVAWQKVTGASLLTGSKGGGGRISGSQGNPNDLAAASLFLPLAVACIPRLAVAGMFAVLGGVPAALSASRQAIIAWVLGVGTVGAFRAGRAGRMRAVWLLVGVAVVGGGTIAASPALRARVMQTMREGVGVRAPLTVYGLELFAQEPVTGIGPGLFGQYYRRDVSEGWEWRGKALPKVGMPWVHSLPVEVLCETGIVGAIAAGAVLFVVVRRAWRGRLADGVRGRVAVSVIAVLLAVGVAGLVDLTFIKDWVRCLVWLTIGLGLWVGSPSTRDGEAPDGR